MSERPIEVDLWTLGRRGYDVHWPIIQAFTADGGFDLRLVLADSNRDLAAYEALPLPMLTLALPVPVRQLPAFPFRLRRDRQRLFRFVKERPRLIHVTMPGPWDMLYLAAAKRAGATILITVHDAMPHPGEENPLIERAQERGTRLADHVAVLTNHVADGLRERRLTDRPIHVVPGGLLTTAGPTLPPRRFPEGRPLRLLFFGRIVRYKGLDLLLDAVAQLRREQFPVELTVAGAGNYAPYRAQLAALDCVRVIDDWISVEDKYRLYAEHDVNMLPYREASQSGPAREGLFAAMPSIATRLGGLVEQLGEGRDTIFTAPDSPGEIAAAIRRLATEPALYERLSTGANAAAEEVTPARAAKNWAALYRTILAGPR